MIATAPCPITAMCSPPASISPPGRSVESILPLPPPMPSFCESPTDLSHPSYSPNLPMNCNHQTSKPKSSQSKLSGPTQVVPTQVVPTQVVPTQVVPIQVVPTKSSQPKSSQSKLSGPTHVIPTQVVPTQVVPTQYMSFQTKSSHPNHQIHASFLWAASITTNQLNRLCFRNAPHARQCYRRCHVLIWRKTISNATQSIPTATGPIPTPTGQTPALHHEDMWQGHFIEQDNMGYRHHHWCSTIYTERYDPYQWISASKSWTYADDWDPNWQICPNPVLPFGILDNCQNNWSPGSHWSFHLRQPIPLCLNQC